MKHYLSLFTSIVFYLFFSSFDLYAPSFHSSRVETSLQLKKNLNNYEHEEHLVVEHVLQNGIKVHLKPSKKEPGTVDYQFFASGGFSGLPIADRAAAWLAPSIIMESGLASLNGDEFACLLDDKGIEIDAKVRQFDHYIQVSCPVREIEYSLQLVNFLFNRPICTETGFRNTLRNAPHRLQKKQQKEKLQSHEIFLKTNLKYPDLASPFSLMNLKDIQLEKILTIYKAFFSNSSDFSFALVGDIDPQEIIPLLESTLGSLSLKPVPEKKKNPPIQFREGIVKKEFYGNNRYKLSLTRLTFPISDKELKPLELDLICSSLKKRIIEFFSNDEHFQRNIKVFYEFPLFPCLDISWIVIQFSSCPAQTNDYSLAILAALEKINKNPLTMNELKQAHEEVSSRKSVNMSDLDELSLISNYSKAGWPLSDFYQPQSLEKIEKGMMKKVVECYPDLQNYSIISLHP